MAETLKPCPFCGHTRSRLMHRTEYRLNADGLTADVYEPDVGFGPEGYHIVKMLDFRHVFYRRCNKCSARSKPVRTDWHVRTQDEADEFSPYSSDKLWGFEPESEWAKPWRDEAEAAWNRRVERAHGDGGRSVKIPPVKTFPGVRPTKEQALKPLEEASEVFGAFQGTCIDYSNPKGEYSCSSCKEAADCYAMSRVVDECCDVIVATCNLLAALGVSDLTEAMAELERKNERRGRYGDK